MMIFFIISSLIASIYADTKILNGVYQRPFHLKNVHMQHDVGFYQFAFGNAETFGFARFNFELHHYSLFTLTDGFCEGDTFLIWDHGIPLFTPTSACPPVSAGTCDFYQPVPSLAIDDGQHCNGNIVLPPGAHNITIEVLNSPFTGGSAFAMLQKLCDFQGILLPCCQLQNNCKTLVYEKV